MQVETNLIVKLGDAELEFEVPGLNEYVTVVNLEENPLDKQADILFAKLLDVRNLFYKDGTPVTVENLREHKLTIPLFAQIKASWFRALQEARKLEADAKKVETPAS